MLRKKFLAKVLLLALIFGYVVVSRNGDRPLKLNIPRAKAGDITSPVWTLSSSTVGATGVTYTHTFTTATDIPANTGRVEIKFDTIQGPIGFTENTRIGSATTDALENSWMEVYPEGDRGLTMAFQNGATAIPAGEITVALTGMKNEQGGVWYTNTYTTDSGSALDGNKNGGANGKITVGDASLIVNAADSSTGSPVVGYGFEVHPFNGGNMWRAMTDASGQATFYGIPNGTYVLETSHDFNPNDANAKTISQYMQVEPQDITLSGTTQTINYSLQKSTKFIQVTVKFSDTGAAIQGAMVNAFNNGGGGFAFSQTDSSGLATLNMSVKDDRTNIMVMVMPQMGPPPGQNGPGGQPIPEPTQFVSKAPSPVSFNRPAIEAETVALEVLVDRPDATVTGKIVNPDGTPAMGGAGAMNFRSHQFQPLMIQQDGSFSFQTKSGMGEWQIERFDPSGNYAMPKTRFTVKKGTNALGTIKLVAYDGAITVKTYRVDSGSDVAVANIPIMAFNTKNSGPPIMGFIGSDGTGTIKVMKGQTYRLMANPKGGGPGNREGGPKEGPGDPGGGPGGPGDGPGGPQGLMQWVSSAFAQEAQSSMMGGSDINQLFPITGPQKGVHGDTLTFKFDKASTQVTVITKDSAGNLVTDGNFVNARPSTGQMFGPGFGGPGAGGVATIYTTTGNVIFNAFYPPNSQYVGKEKEVDITGATTVELVVLKKTVTISGEIQDASNNNAVIKGETAKKLNLMVGAFFKGGFSDGVVNPDTGTYVVKVPPTLNVNIGVAPADAIMGGTSEYVPSLSPDSVNAADGESVTRHLRLAKVDATINVTVKDQDGNPIEGISVFANNKLADIVGPGGPSGPGPGPEGPEEPEFGFSGVTDSNGLATIAVAPDTYNLVTDARERGLFATDISNVEIKSQETKAVTINLVKADATLEVEINKAGGSDLNDAAVSVFNDKGTIAFQVRDGSEDDKDGSINGVVKFDIPANKSGDAYAVKAGKDDPESGAVEGSDFIKVILDKDETEKTTLTTVNEASALAQSITSSVSTSSSATLDLTKGGSIEASLAIPSGALSSGSTGESEEGGSSDSDTTTISITPMKEEVVNTKSDVVIKGIKIEAIDGSGNEVTTLSSQATGTIRYTDGDIPTGMTEAQFVDKAKVKAFNESAGVWENVAASNCDASTNVCTFATTHFTDFAITASADTTAPSAPTGISASAGDAKATLSWTNPTDSDFAGVKIYRSTTEGTLGDLVTSTASTTTTSYENTGLTNGVKYYYTVRSYDTAGNISTNTTQVNATPGILPATGMTSMVHNTWVRITGFLSTLF